jgi:mRNA-degrading endonuclease RelE of RelBE toxin-antitoxin system
VKGWKVELSNSARREFRRLDDGPRQAAAHLIGDLGEDPELVPALELRGKPNIWRAWFHNDRYRMIHQIARSEKPVIVKRIRIRPNRIRRHVSVGTGQRVRVTPFSPVTDTVNKPNSSPLIDLPPPIDNFRKLFNAP